MTELLAYTKGISKAEFVAEMKWHKEQDNFIRGTYDEGFGGCAVGCSLKSVAKLKGIKLDPSNHAEFEEHLGVPEWLAHLEDTLFENVSAERKDAWPVEFSEAINEGSNLENIKVPFIVFLMHENLKSIRAAKYDADKYPEVKKANDLTEAALLQMIEAQESGDAEKIQAAESAARSAASAAWSAGSAAWSAESAESAAWSAAYDRYADKLLELMRDCK